MRIQDRHNENSTFNKEQQSPPNLSLHLKQESQGLLTLEGWHKHLSLLLNYLHCHNKISSIKVSVQQLSARAGQKKKNPSQVHCEQEFGDCLFLDGFFINSAKPLTSTKYSTCCWLDLSHEAFTEKSRLALRRGCRLLNTNPPTWKNGIWLSNKGWRV